MIFASCNGSRLKEVHSSCLIAVCVAVLQLPHNLKGAQIKEGQVTAVVHDVNLVTGEGSAPRPALVNDTVGAGTSVGTGVASWAALSFADQIVARLGPNTVLTSRSSARNLELADGAVLLDVSKKVKGAKVRASPVAAAVAGTTVIFEYHPGVYKFLVLRGTGRLYRPRHPGDSVLVRAGQMVIGNPDTVLSSPVDFDIGRFLKTSRFIIDFPPLPSETLLTSEIQKQQRQKSKKVLRDTNLVIFGGGTLVSLIDPTKAAAADQKTAVSGATISSPTPNGIPSATSTTAITPAVSPSASPESTVTVNDSP
jgi:hypothetical protein